MLILNPDDFERGFKQWTANLHHDEAKNWIQTVAKVHLLNPGSADWNENFVVYDPTKKNPLHGEAPTPDRLTDEAKAALERGETLYWFDPIQPTRRKFWHAISQHINMWLNNAAMADANYAGLAFESADRIAQKWFGLMSAYYPDNNKDKIPARKPEGSLWHAKCGVCGHEFDLDYNRYRAKIVVAISCSKCFELIPPTP